MFYNTADNAWQVPDNIGNRLAARGILSYRQDQVANPDSEVVYASGDEIEVITMGVVWAIAGAALERGNQVSMAVGSGTDAFQWIGVTRVTAITDMYSSPMECYSVAAADNQIFKVAVGYGRAI